MQQLLTLYNNDTNFVSADTRTKALSYLKSTTPPTRKNESWRYTDVKKLLDFTYSKAHPMDVNQDLVKRYRIQNLDAYVLVFVNGFFSAANSNTEGLSGKVILKSMSSLGTDSELTKSAQYGLNATSLHEQSIFTALNTAFAADGTLIHIARNTEVDKPIHILNLVSSKNQDSIVQTRNLVIAEPNSRVKIIQTYHSLLFDGSFTNVATEIFVQANASVEYHLLQCEGEQDKHLNTTKVIQEHDSRFVAHTATLYGKTVRNELSVQVQGEHCETVLNGVYLADKEQHFDNQVYVHHAQAHCQSSQLYKGIVDDKAETVFDGKVYVARDAQQTDAAQSNKNISISNQAKIHSKPQLEIYADDVKCAHGSTTGQLDTHAMFYLRARGLGKKEARTLLMTAFAAEVAQKITIEPYKALVEHLIEQRLKGEKIHECTMLTPLSNL